VDDVIAAPGAKQVGQDAHAEHERRKDPSPPTGGVESHAWARCQDPDTWVEIQQLPSLPLAECQVGDLVAFIDKALGQVSVPALGTADGVRKQAVVDDADAHPASISSDERAGLAAPLI
jgi:hypothetical protein